MQIVLEMDGEDAVRLHSVLEGQVDILDAEREGLDTHDSRWKGVIEEIREDRRVCRIVLDALEAHCEKRKAD